MNYRRLGIKEGIRLTPKILDNYAEAYLSVVIEKKLDVARIWSPISQVSILNPIYVGRVMEENQKNYKKSKLYKPFRTLLGEGMVTAHGDKWKRQRRMVSPTLNQRNVLNLLGIIEKNTLDLVSKWNTKLEPSPTEISADVMALTLDIFCEIFFGKALKEQGTVLGNELVSCFEVNTNKAMNPLSSPYFVPTKENRNYKKSRRIIDEICLDFINKARNGEIGEEYLLTKMVHAKDEIDGSQLSTQQLMDEVITLIFAGYETTSLSISWALYLLSRHPEVAKKMQAEVDAVIGSEPANSESTKELTYTKMVFKEALRMYPAVPSVSREALKEDMIGDVKIKKGDTVTINPFVYHRHPDFWDQPNEFIPERHLEPPKHKHAFLPFLTGARACVGEHLAWLEGTWILALILKNFDLEKVTDKEMGTYPVATLRMAEPFYLKLHKRVATSIVANPQREFDLDGL